MCSSRPSRRPPLRGGGVSGRASFKEGGGVGYAGEPGGRWQLRSGASMNPHLNDAIVRRHAEIDLPTVVLHVEARLVTLAPERSGRLPSARVMSWCPVEECKRPYVARRLRLSSQPPPGGPRSRSICPSARGWRVVGFAPSGSSRFPAIRLAIYELRLESSRDVSSHDRSIYAEADKDPTSNDPLSNNRKAHRAIIGAFGTRGRLGPPR